MAEFKPHLTPAEMLERGVFGGAYFERASYLDLEGLDPQTLRLARTQTGPFRKVNNCYGAKAGETYEQWMANGWIFSEDPLGWFHWYCRYHNGRRHERDAHQIRRHNHYRERWGRFARTQLLTRGDASAVVKQGLLQWALEPMFILHGEI